MRRFPISMPLIAALCLPMASRADGIDALVAKLGDDSYEVRVEATRELIRREVDHERLRKLAAATSDPEIRKRLEGVIGLSGELWAKLPRQEIRKLQPTASEDGKSLYLARAEVDGSTLIGKHMPEWDGANFPIGDEEVMVMNFTLWTGKGIWKPWRPGLQEMIGMGKTKDGKTVYAVRAKFGDGTHPGWVCVAYDSNLGLANVHNGAYVLALEKLREVWPGFAGWTIATGGSSGGAKGSLSNACLLTSKEIPVRGVFLAGCNSAANMTWGCDTYKVSKADVREMRVFISTGKKDNLVSCGQVESVIATLREEGVRIIRDESFEGGHEMNREHFVQGLEWFAQDTP